jgi:hypothetical protein
MLILQITEGCYLSTNMTNARLRDVSLTVANDRIFIAGGSSANSVSSTVHIFEPQSNSWEQIQLPTARKSIVTAAIGSSVLFAGGLDQQNQPYNHVNIYDFRTGRWVTLDYDTRHVIRGSVVARSQVFLYAEQDELVIVNPASNSTSTLSHSGRFVDATSNATHIFFLVYQGNTPNIEIFDIDARTWQTIPAIAPFSEIVQIFHVTNLLALVGRQQAHVFSLRSSFQRNFTFTSNTDDAAQVVAVGDDLFFLTRDSVTVASMPRVATVHYSIARTAVVESNLVVHNNIVYFTGPARADSNNELFRFELNQLFQRMDVNAFHGMPTDAESGVLFWIWPAAGTIRALELRRRRIDTFSTTFRKSDEAVSVKVNSNLLIVSGDPDHLGEGASNEYDLYNFNTRTVTTRRMNTAFAATSGTAMGDYAAFTTTTNFVHVFEEPSRIWFRVFSELPTQFVALIDNHVIMVHSTMIETYGIRTRETRLFGITRPSSDRRTTKYFSTLALVWICDRTANGTSIITYRHRDRSLTYYHINYTIESIAEVFGYVIFNVVTTTHPQKMFVFYFEEDNGSFDFREITLPVNVISPNDKNPARYASAREFLYLVRPFRVDVLNVVDWTITHLPSITIGQPLQVLMVGSKLVILHTLDAAQYLLIYERSTQEVQTIEIRNVETNLNFDAHDNFIYTNNWSTRFQMMPLTTVVSPLRENTLFLGQTAIFATIARSAVGDLQFTWRQNSQLVDNRGQVLSIQNVTEEMTGEYSVEVTDQCNHRMISTANLHVHGKPIFVTPLQYSTILCHDPTTIAVDVNGTRVSYTWTINGVDHDTAETSVTVNEEKIECNTEGTLCVTATNPSGSSSSCARVRVLPLESIFVGPAPVVEQQNWFVGSEAKLRVSVLDDHCTSHAWFIEDTMLARFDNTRESTLGINVTRGLEHSKIFVRTYCGSSVIVSRAFSFTQVSVLSEAELAVIIVSGSVVFIAAIVIIVVVAKKRKATNYKKMGKYELDTLKTEFL